MESKSACLAISWEVLKEIKHKLMNNVPTHKRQLLNINELVCFFAITSLAPRFCSRKLLNKSIHLNAPMPALHPLSSCMFMYIKSLFLFLVHHILDELRLCNCNCLFVVWGAAASCPGGVCDPGCNSAVGYGREDSIATDAFLELVPTADADRREV